MVRAKDNPKCSYNLGGKVPLRVKDHDANTPLFFGRGSLSSSTLNSPISCTTFTKAFIPEPGASLQYDPDTLVRVLCPSTIQKPSIGYSIRS